MSFLQSILLSCQPTKNHLHSKITRSLKIWWPYLKNSPLMQKSAHSPVGTKSWSNRATWPDRYTPDLHPERRKYRTTNRKSRYKQRHVLNVNKPSPTGDLLPVYCPVYLNGKHKPGLMVFYRLHVCGATVPGVTDYERRLQPQGQHFNQHFPKVVVFCLAFRFVIYPVIHRYV